jgi:hypothetical protein
MLLDVQCNSWGLAKIRNGLLSENVPVTKGRTGNPGNRNIALGGTADTS